VSYATIDDLRSQLGGVAYQDTKAYADKMKHPIPPYQNVDRVAFILKHCDGKRVLEFGASGPLTEQIKSVAAFYMGVDRENGDHIVGMDLDDVADDLEFLVDGTPYTPELVVCGEVLEHLGNPLHFLARLKQQYPNVPVIVSVPNAFSSICQEWLKKGIENVNADHVAWYSPKTLGVLLERAGYTVGALYYYNGDGPTAEGLIVCTE
jgi:hypothetical protein